MTTASTPYTPRVRCWRCQGRRVIKVDHIDYIELVPCPSCHHTDPSASRLAHVEHGSIEARAA